MDIIDSPLRKINNVMTNKHLGGIGILSRQSQVVQQRKSRNSIVLVYAVTSSTQLAGPHAVAHGEG